MHEHFRKKLQWTTPTEQRAIMAQAAIRKKMLEQNTEEEEQQIQTLERSIPRAQTSTSSTGFRSPATIETRLQQVQEEKFSARQMKRKATSPLRLSQRLRRSGATFSDSCDGAGDGEAITAPAATASQSPAIHAALSVPCNPAATSATPEDSSATGRKQRNSASSTTPTRHSRLSLQNAGEGNAGDVVNERGELQLERAAEEAIEDVIFRTSSVVHALYYCSGDMGVATSFLKGASPSDMWSPQDDLLLANLVELQDVSRLAVDSAVARGDLASMQVSRSTGAVLERVKFLR